MNQKTVNFLTGITTALAALLFLSWWMLRQPAGNFVIHAPGMDGRPASMVIQERPVNLGSFFEKYDGQPSSIQSNWPRFRGQDFDNINKEKIKLADGFAHSQPRILWQVNLGEGHAAPAVYQGKVYVLDYDEKEKMEICRCFSLDDGREIWRRGHKIMIKRNHGMSRTVPAVNGKVVVTIGPKCHVMCLDAANGDFKWGTDLVRDYGAEVPLWYTGQCPLIDGSHVIIASGGNSLMMALECETGKVVWQTPNPQKLKMSHSSIIPMTVEGQKLYVYCALGGIVGVAAGGDKQGKIAFFSNLWNHRVIAPSPVYLGNSRIFVTAGYGAGSMIMKITRSGSIFTVRPEQKFKSNEGLASEQQTPLLYQGHLYSILPKDAGSLRNQFVCSPVRDCTRFTWTSGKTNRFGLGPYIAADNKFYVLSDDGFLTILKASTSEYIQLARIKILQGVDCWGPLAIVQGRLLARDSRQLVCIDVRSQT